jgi:hypothetical protein
VKEKSEKNGKCKVKRGRQKGGGEMEGKGEK